MLPQLSVVIPMYNAAMWVEETLASVVGQGFPHERLEIIAVDDGSKDDSPAIARAFLARTLVRHQVVVREKNGGIGAARNTGCRAASGDWVQFLDADDLLAPHKLELQATRAADAPPEVAVVYSNWQYFELSDGKWQPAGALHAPCVDDEPLLQILEHHDFGYVGPTIVRKSWVERVGGFTEQPNIGEDLHLMLRVAMAGGRFREARSATAAFLYRQTPGSAWRRSIHNVEAMRNLALAFRAAEEFLRAEHPGDLPERARAALAGRYGRFPELYLEADPATFRSLMGWMRGLGFDKPPNLTPPVRAAANVIGYENTLRLRSALGRQRARFRSWGRKLLARGGHEEH